MPDGKGGYTVKLADFDFAKNLKDADKDLLINCGTTGFLSPELTRGECFGLSGAQANDIFSLGASMLELVDFSIWHNYISAPENVAGKTNEEILNGFHSFIGNLEHGSPEHIKLEEQFQDYKTQNSPLTESDESYLNLAWSMINPDPDKRPKIKDVTLQLLMLDLGV
jgi:serine/threonine protein kinase